MKENEIFYCDDCKKNICNICNKDCLSHKRKEICYDVNTVDKGVYLINKLNGNDKNFIEEDNELNLEDESDHEDNKYQLIPIKKALTKNEINTNTKKKKFKKKKNMKAKWSWLKRRKIKILLIHI